MRDHRLEDLFCSLELALLDQPTPYPGRHVAEMVFQALTKEHGTPDQAESADLPVLGSLKEAIDLAKTASPRSKAVADCLEPLLPVVPWRASRGYDDPAFNRGHANAVLVGKGGLERRSDFTIGISFASAGTCYPMHNHPPEELYFALAGGDFRHGDEGWTNIPAGETFYNEPGIIHAMRANSSPLLAIWIFGRR